MVICMTATYCKDNNFRKQRENYFPLLSVSQQTWLDQLSEFHNSNQWHYRTENTGAGRTGHGTASGHAGMRPECKPGATRNGEDTRPSAEAK